MYKDENDCEIIYMINENVDNYVIILEKYKPLINKICFKYLRIAKELGYELEDLIQVANIALVEAVNGYLENQNTLFYTYATVCIENNLKNEIRNNQTNKKQALNNSFSYDNYIDNTNLTYLEVIADNNLDALDYLSQEEEYFAYLDFKNSLPFEMSLVLELKLNGFLNDEIGILLEMKKRTVIKYLRILSKKMKNLEV